MLFLRWSEAFHYGEQEGRLKPHSNIRIQSWLSNKVSRRKLN
jgi:hypothetical protein